MWDKALHEIPEAEFQRRLERVRGFALERNLAGVVVYYQPKIHQWSQADHVGYLTNWSNLDRMTDSMVIVPREGDPVLLVSGVDFMRDQIEPVSWMRDVRMVRSPDPRAIAAAYNSDADGDGANAGARTFGGETAEILNATGSAGRPIGISGFEAMSVALYRDLESSVSDGIVDVPDIVGELRSIKSAGEVSLLRQTAAVSDRGYEVMMDTLTDGILGYELTAEMDHSGRRLGGDLVYHCTHWPPGGDLASGHLSLKPLNQQIRTGDYINVNAYVVRKGYWIQSDRAGTVGASLGGSAGKVVEANLAAQDEALAAIRPGLPIDELLNIANRAAEKLGYEI